ncbi:MAG: SDR family oxidoreductase [Clostridiales bacterium]|nr:SDR family oxidoreductase [Clostridiales bacterium]
MKKNWLYNKTVIITGASSGFGKILATRFIKDFNCKVIGVARNIDKLNALKEELGENFITYPFDVSVKENWESLKKYLMDKSVAVDILINNAGVMPPFAKFDYFSDEEIEKTFNINFLSYLYSIKTFLPVLENSSTPAIINVSSLAGLVPVVGASIYCASKGAVRFFTEAIEEEYRKKIYVAGIYPGFSKTNLFSEHNIDKKSDKMFDLIATKPEKAVNKMVRKLKRKKKRIVIGKDAFLLRLLYFFFPKSANKIVSFFFKKSKLTFFDKLFK